MLFVQSGYFRSPAAFGVEPGFRAVGQPLGEAAGYALCDQLDQLGRTPRDSPPFD